MTFILAGLTVLMIVFFLAIRIWIGHSIKENITIAERQYSGSPEDALIAYWQIQPTRLKTDHILPSGLWDRYGRKRQHPI